MDRLTYTDDEMEKIRTMILADYDCPIKAEKDSTTNTFCNLVCDEFEEDCPFAKVGLKLKAYEDAEENGMLIRLDSKDELIKILATKLCESEFGNCYMCKNPMKNITLDGKNNGCDGQCNTSEEFTVDDFLKKIVWEIEALKQMGE